MTSLRFRIDSDIARQAGLAARIARGQSDVSSQKRLQAPSDDPAAAVRIAQLRRAQTNESAWRANVDNGIARATRTDSALTGVASLIDRARELAINGASETLSNADRATIALELRSIADEVDNLSQGIDATGPIAADGLFHPRARATYDAAICMYHDQALIPLKALHFDEGVNVTLGLPIIRTSPDHGTAFGIAGRNIANPGAMIAAIRLAAQEDTAWRRLNCGV